VEKSARKGPKAVVRAVRVRRVRGRRRGRGMVELMGVVEGYGFLVLWRDSRRDLVMGGCEVALEGEGH